MSISFSCACGKTFSVADEYAGKRTKCPACGVALTVPVPAAESAPPNPEADEDAAYRALLEAPEVEPATAPPSREKAAWSSTVAPAPAARTEPTPAAKRGAKSASRTKGDRSTRSRRPAIHISPGVLGGLGSMLLAVVWFVLGWSAGVIYFYPPVLFFFGFMAFVRGMLGYSED